MPEPFDLSPTDAAKRIGCSVDSLKAWAKEGLVAAIVTPGGHWRFRASDVDTFVASLAHTPAPTEPEQAAS